MGDARWCKHGIGAAACCEQHIRELLPPGPNRGRNRQCPACHDANLSVNPGDGRMWMVWNCFGGCDPADVRAALEVAGADALCLGSYCSDEWQQRRERRDLGGFTGRADPPTLAAARRSYAYAKLISSDVSGTLLRMCMRVIEDSDGNVSGDPDELLPRDLAEFAALAKRIGIERTYAYRLARQWLSKYGA